MSQPRKVEIPFQLTVGADQRCIDVLKMVLEKQPGMAAVNLDVPTGQLLLRYDPALVSLTHVQQLARQLGIELGRHYEQCALRQHGLHCADCALGLEEEMAAGAARVIVNPAAEAIGVAYDPLAANLGTVEERISRDGYQAPPPRTRAALKATHAREGAERKRMAALTARCLSGLLLGWAGETFRWLAGPVVLGLYALAYLAGGFYSTRRALRELRTGAVSVDFLMIAAALGAALVGEYPEGAILLFLFSFSNTLEQYVLGYTRHAIEALMDLTPEEASVRRDGREQRVPVEQLRVGDIVIVRPGERIAADGLIANGQTSVDESAMTGEAAPVEKGLGEVVRAGTLNQQGAVEIRVTRLAGETALARIVQLVEQAQSEKAQSERFTDWFGQRYTIAVLTSAALVFVAPVLLFGDPVSHAFYRAMTMLVVASPCAVVISIPAAILTAITSAARGGVLFKGGVHLERAAEIRAVAFDKTGTLTAGHPRLTDLITADGVSVNRLLSVAASAESRSEHPLAKAIVEAASARGLPLEPASRVEALAGRGIHAQIGARAVWVGKADLLLARGCSIPTNLAVADARFEADGATTVYVSDGQEVLGLLVMADTLRPSASEAIHALRASGLEHLVMLTGDRRRVAQTIAGRLGIEFEAELLPEDKLTVIHRLRERHGVVAMVGDGINDAPSLASADLGISLGGAGTDIALETADVVLMADDLRHLPYALGLARAAKRIIRQNLVFAFGMMAVLLAVTFFGSLRLPLAVVGHEGSTVLVILNGLRLLLFPRPARAG
ncbi:MAG: cadmium-translocating P-type ATPase [Chloroflexi bacterium]|nr:cadmium-translocating P-type ATPase [Chloroflexota bacterium]